MATMAPIAGCALTTVTAEPCAVPPVSAEALEIRAEVAEALERRRRGIDPRVDEPPFTSTHWVSRAGMPVRWNPRGWDVPTGHTAIYKGWLYIVYQGFQSNVSGAGPVPTNWLTGCIVRTQDGVTWQIVFEGGTPAPAGHLAWRAPGTLYIRNDTLYCVMLRGGSSYVEAWAYLTDGEIATWKTTDGLAWTKQQVLVSWAAAGAGENVGGRAAFAAFAPTPVWQGAGSGPAGEAADWLIAGYHAFASVPGAPVLHTATPQYRSLDGGETWTEVRNMKGVYPFTANPGGAEGPTTVLGVPRPGVSQARWVMLGGDGGVNYSDDAGATWTHSPTDGGHTVPSDAHALQTGGLVFTLPGTGAFGPGEQISCDYGASRLLIQTSGVSGNANTTFTVLQFGTAGGEELLASTARSGQAVWHTTNGGETWADRGSVPVALGVSYTLARIPGGRVLLYGSSGGGGVTDCWSCDDPPTDVATPRTICPFTVPIGAPLARIAGCALLTFVNEPCGGLPPLSVPETCEAPLGAFVLGVTCLGDSAPLARRLARGRRRRTHAHA